MNFLESVSLEGKLGSTVSTVANPLEVSRLRSNDLSQLLIIVAVPIELSLTVIFII